MKESFQRVEDVGQVIVGVTYDVAALFHLYHKCWIPLIGTEHEDAEIIGFPHSHWHIDWRFATEGFYGRSLSWELTPHGTVFTRQSARNDPNFHGDIRRKRMKCKRPMPEFPGETLVKWLPKLEQLFENRTMTNMICPHRGMPLTGCPVKDGVVVCPGHGLAWNIENGRLAKRCATPQKGARA